jgi:hypothetical protein
MNETNKQTKPTYENKLVEAGALFKRVSSKGTPYLFIKVNISDSLGQLQPHLFRAFPNKFHKEGETTPSWILYVADDKAITTKPVKTVKPTPKKEVEIPQAEVDANDDATL